MAILRSKVDYQNCFTKFEIKKPVIISLIFQETAEKISKENGFLLFLAGPPSEMGLAIYKDLPNNQAFVSVAYLQAMAEENRIAVLHFPYSGQAHHIFSRFLNPRLLFHEILFVLFFYKVEVIYLDKKCQCKGKSFSEALIFASTNPQYDKRLFIELQVQYIKTTKTICVHNMF